MNVDLPRPPASDAHILGTRAAAMLEQLGAISESASVLTRRFLTPEHRRAADLVAHWMRTAGLRVDEDALGTVRGKLPGRDPSAQRLLIGSHIDTVVDAGKYDGPLGVVLGILAAEHFARGKLALPFGLEILAFGDEEGSRFPSTFSSSNAIAGTFDPATLAQRDNAGTTLAAAIRAYGKSEADIARAAYKPSSLLGYVEVHIEQGPNLVRAGAPLGVVTGIVGQTRLRITLEGMSGHAGCVPMPDRRDALAGAAEMVSAVEAIARGREGVVATVGHLEASPGAINVIPGHVMFTIDLRTLDNDVRESAARAIRKRFREIAKARNLDLTISTSLQASSVMCDKHFRERFSEAMRGFGLPEVELHSGAGHDAQIVAQIAPMGMLFVRCRDGISHNPAEYAAPDDMAWALQALIRFIELTAASQAHA